MLLLVCFGQQGNSTPKPRMRDEPLSADQIAIYRAVLMQFIENPANRLIQASTLPIEPPPLKINDREDGEDQ